MKTQLTLLITVLLLISCNENKRQSNNPKNETIAEAKVINSQKTKQLEKKIDIKFRDFTITIDSLEAFDEHGVLKEIQKDTATVYLELGESIEGKKIKITPSKFANLEIYQRHENSMTILQEGPHCDLTEWKHYNSEWKRIKEENNAYVAYKHTRKERKKGVKATAEEFMEAVEKHCGSEWSQLLKDKKNIGDYSVTSGISRIFLKVVVQQENGEKQEKIISFIMPLGC